MKLIHAGKQFYFAAEEVQCVCESRCLPVERLTKAVDVSGGSKRSAVIMRNGNIYLVDLALDTLRGRLAGASRE